MATVSAKSVKPAEAVVRLQFDRGKSEDPQSFSEQ